MTTMSTKKAVCARKMRTVGGIPLANNQGGTSFKWKKKPLRFLLPDGVEYPQDRFARFSDKQRALFVMGDDCCVFHIFFFGKDDGRPFVTALEPSGPVLAAIRARDEQAFEKALRPRRLRDLAGNLDVPVWRSGDILGIPVAKSWEDVENNPLFRERVGRVTGEDLPLFETRHRLHGEYTELIWEEDGGSTFVLAAGTITAPDHPRRKLKGVHLVTRNRWIVEACADVEMS